MPQGHSGVRMKAHLITVAGAAQVLRSEVSAHLIPVSPGACDSRTRHLYALHYTLNLETAVDPLTLKWAARAPLTTYPYRELR